MCCLTFAFAYFASALLETPAKPPKGETTPEEPAPKEPRGPLWECPEGDFVPYREPKSAFQRPLQAAKVLTI